jgi:hypothetical protein
MSKVVPSKFMSANVRIGADSFKEIKTELTRLLPVGVNSSTAYSPTSLNKIVWRLPCYSQCFLDNSRSFISFTAKLTGGTGATSNGAFGNGLPIFERVVVKTSDGLTLEDITDFNVLQRLFTITSAEEDYGVHRGVYGSTDPSVAVGALLSSPGVVYTFQMSQGILGKDLSSYLPVFMMGTTYCLDLELYLAPANSCMVSYNGPAGLSYTINNPVYNLCLLRMDSSLCAKFNEIACNPSERISIPYTTFRNHVSTLTSQNNTVHIHESGTNLKRIWSVYTDAVQTTNGTVLPFRGSVKTTQATHQITKYNYKLGTQFLYNEPVEEKLNNNITLNHVKNAVWSSGKPMILSKTDTTRTGTLFEEADAGMFMTVANMTYSPEEMKEVCQGISSTNPIELTVSFNGVPASALLVHNYCELGYNLTIQNGMVRYEEQKPGSQSVY